MTKNFIEVGGTYQSENGWYWKCICIDGDHAWLTLSGVYGDVAYLFRLDGTPVSHPGSKEYQLLPPKPKIDKDKANLDRTLDESFICMDWDHEGTNGFLYTHTEAKVALFVPENIDGETLAEAIGELQEEIGG